ncbi:hypothetical protein CCGE531_13980 [Rhizobium sp. CCGE531]|nr:hypothetical protein CCGE531_13980 [Rhizobium sp. CCGE531]AYG73367.1 hypothetical protein CCGE532_13400 [Rhizobium sp. CCGE532]
MRGLTDLNAGIFVLLAGTPSSAWRHLLPEGRRGTWYDFAVTDGRNKNMSRKNVQRFCDRDAL